MSSGDIFDEVEKYDNSFAESGEKDGYNDGLEMGLKEGRDLGLQKGFEIGQELGFYIGCIRTWKYLNNSGVHKMPERVSKLTTTVEELIQSFPLDDPQNEDILTILEKVRGKFKVIAQAMGCIGAYYNREAVSLTF